MEPIITSEQLQAAYNDGLWSGLWHGGLGVGLIIFGIIGWPATRYVLGVLVYPFTRRQARKPIGSPYWDKYNSPHRKAAFNFQEFSTSARKK